MVNRVKKWLESKPGLVNCIHEVLPFVSLIHDSLMALVVVKVVSTTTYLYIEQVWLIVLIVGILPQSIYYILPKRLTWASHAIIRGTGFWGVLLAVGSLFNRVMGIMFNLNWYLGALPVIIGIAYLWGVFTGRDD